MIYKTETHLHTKESSVCSEVSVQEIIPLYKTSDYKTIIITDHYSFSKFSRFNTTDWNEVINILLKGYKTAKILGDSNGLTILYGIELTLLKTGSDYLIYGITEEFLKANKYLYDLTLEKLYKLCSDNGFLLIQAHPFRDDVQQAPKNLIMGVELYNGCQNEVSRNELAVLYAKENHLIGTSGSDFHRKDDLARGGIITKEEIKTIDDYIRIIKKNDFEIISNTDNS